MEIVVMDGFDQPDTIPTLEMGWVYESYTRNTGDTYNDEGASAHLSTSSNYLRHQFSSAIASGEAVRMAFAVKFGSGFDVFFGLSEAASTVSLTYSDAYLLFRGATDGALVMGTGSGASVEYTGVDMRDQWFHIEQYGEYTNGGAYDVRINGASVLSGTWNPTGENWNYVVLEANHSNAGGTYYDDVIIARGTPAELATPFGISKVRWYNPTGTAVGEWTGSDGNSTDNHLLVDDADPASAEYVTSTAGSGDTDLYTFGTVAPAGATVHGIRPIAAASLDAIGTDSFSEVLKSGSTESVQPRTLGTGTPVFSAGSPVHHLDPDTGAPWTVAAANAFQFGVRS